MFFCKQTYCDTCGVAFKPVTGVGDNLCSVHRAPLIEEYRRRSAVVDWAFNHWETVEKIMITEQTLQQAAYQRSPEFQRSMQAMAAQQNGAPIHGYGGASQQGNMLWL